MIQRNGDERAERRFRIALFGVLLLVLVGVHFVDPSFYPTIYQLSMDGDLKGTIAYLKTFGVYAVFMSFFIPSSFRLRMGLSSVSSGGRSFPGWQKRWASSSPST